MTIRAANAGGLRDVCAGSRKTASELVACGVSWRSASRTQAANFIALRVSLCWHVIAVVLWCCAISSGMGCALGVSSGEKGEIGSNAEMASLREKMKAIGVDIPCDAKLLTHHSSSFSNESDKWVMRLPTGWNNTPAPTITFESRESYDAMFVFLNDVKVEHGSRTNKPIVSFEKEANGSLWVVDIIELSDGLYALVARAVVRHYKSSAIRPAL